SAYLVDFEQRFLAPLPDRSKHADLAETEEVVSSMAGRAFLTRAPVTAKRHEKIRVWVPIIEGSDRTGVLAMTFGTVDDDVLAACMDLGMLAGYLIAAHTRCTDVYQLHRRRKSMSLAASMQWDLLPPVVLSTARCTVAARLEPAYEVGGDCFDYSLNSPVLDVALVDSMGHGVSSAMIASLVIGCYRHDRREGRSLEDMHRSIDDALNRQFRGDAFATGQLAQLELTTGQLSWINAGHPRPLLVRGGRVIKELEGPPVLPWGLQDQPAVTYQESLEPSDEILFYTDGITDAANSEGKELGIDRLIDITGQCASDQLPPEEIVRKIVEAVMQHQGRKARDDATLMMVQWHGGP
ncbi:MAG TPA: PP2C family protein-serine/threonine phosphatase, partial [Actinomycetota bacterium]|nr:PP2C family protein-serine/threonine phosphatase [Actinomycetota bacterium]